MTKEVTNEDLNKWATEETGPVAIHMKQKLLPIEAVNGEVGVIFPPTYADIGYNIDTLSDGTQVATIDSVGSQANRLEMIFKTASQNRDEWLVPQIEIVLRSESCGECEECKSAEGEGKKRKSNDCKTPQKVKRSIIDLAHRAADAVVQSSPGLNKLIKDAFKSLQEGDAGPLCALAPTSLVFGVWDSRGGSGEKRPRLVRSIIRAWDVEPLHAAAQFNSVWKALNEEQKEELRKEATAKKVELSEKGFADAPAVFRKTKIQIQKYRDGAPNPEARVLGGILARGRIERQVTVNLVALHGLRGNNSDETSAIRKYLLGLSLMAATTDIELFLREGCHLRYTDEDNWYEVLRRGEPKMVEFRLDSGFLREYAMKAAKPFRSKWPESVEYTFNLSEAKRLLAKKAEAEEETGGGA
jgi:CRISPR-associated protein Csb1